jgi:hypothetical protein
MHEDARKIQLHTETNVDISAVNSGGPPQSESAVGDLSQPRSLSICELFELPV